MVFLFLFRACGTGRPGRHPPCPPSSCYLGGFSGFEDPDLSSLTESGQKWGPNCADDVPVRGARAPRTGTSPTIAFHWYLQPQTLPTACILSVLLGFISHLPCSPPRASIMSIMGPVWAPNFHTYEASRPLQNPRYVEVAKNGPKMRNEGPIVLMMLTQNFMPKTIPTVGGSLKNAAKNHLNF